MDLFDDKVDYLLSKVFWRTFSQQIICQYYHTHSTTTNVQHKNTKTNETKTDLLLVMHVR